MTTKAADQTGTSANGRVSIDATTTSGQGVKLPTPVGQAFVDMSANTTPVMYLRTDLVDNTTYAGNNSWNVRDENGRVRKLALPSVATASDEDLSHHPRGHNRYSVMVNRSGNTVPIMLTTAPGIIPKGGRHIEDEHHRYIDDLAYRSCYLRVATCLDKQIAIGQVNPEWLHVRELADAEPCPASCCSQPLQPWEAHTIRCPKVLAEQAARRKVARELYEDMTRASTEAEMARDLEVSKRANEQAAQVLGPAIAQSVSAAIEAMESRREAKSKKGKRDE